MALGTLATFWAVSALFVVTPGADWAYVIGAGIHNRSVLPAVAGLLAGHLAATCLVAVGVAALLAGAPTILTALTAVGAGYLIWLGATAWLTPTPPTLDSRGQAPSATLRQAVRGFGVSGLNPKVLLLFLALLPQFTDPTARWPVWGQILVLGLVHVTSCAVVYLAVGVSARRVLQARPAAARTVGRVSGITMIAIGGVLLLDLVAG